MLKLINPFVYEECEKYNVSSPDIRAFLGTSYAQCYEDVILISLLKAMTHKLDEVVSYGYLEIGANHPISTSSTYLLKKQLGASGILVEPNPRLIDELKRIREQGLLADTIIEAACVAGDEKEVDIIINNDQNELSSMDGRFVQSFAKNGASITVQRVVAININELMQMAHENYNMYSLFIDVEGPDAAILEAINYVKYRPVTIQIEASEHLVPGNSQRMINCMKFQDYLLIAKTDVNLIFIDGERL